MPAGLIENGAEHQFCCGGCKAVFAVIRGCGLDQYYKLREREAAEAEPARPGGSSFAEFDDAVFHDLYVATLDDGRATAELVLEGVHCGACVWLIEKLPRVVDGVIEARLSIRSNLVRVTWNPQRVALSRIARALDSLGYRPHAARDSATRDARRREDRRFLIRLAVAGAAAGNVMLMAIGLYGGMFSYIEPEHATLMRWMSMAFGLVALLWPGSLFFRGAWAALRARSVHMDIPVALGLAAGGVAGVINTFTNRGEIYFDSLAVLVFFLLVGRWIQHCQQRGAADAVEMLFSLTPSVAQRVSGESVEQVPIEALRRGEIVEVRAGESVPVDGEVVNGTSQVDQALLTGETRPQDVAPGEHVCAGVVNLSATIRVRVESVGQATRVGRLMALVEECARRKPPLVKLADQIAGWFVGAVVALAALTFVLWLRWDAPHAVDHAVALLIVTCPCALGLATPLAVALSIGAAAKQGILIKGGDVLERLARAGTMLLDKTGTLTEGRVRVVRWYGDEEVIAAVGALEAQSSHPTARALHAFATERRSESEIGACHVIDISQTTARGVAGTVDGLRVMVGSARFVLEQLDDSGNAASCWRGDCASAGLSPVLVAADGRVVAAAGLSDTVRADAPAALAALRAMHWRIVIVSGDQRDVVAAVAEELNTPSSAVHAEVAPERKLEIVEAAGGEGTVVMIGDGVNDAAALSAADVGVAVHGGAEVSLAAADVYLSRPGLAPIVSLVHIGRRTVRVIRKGLVVSLAYNAVTASLAMAGAINPLIAAILMPASSLTVLAIALRAGRGNV